LGKRLLDSHTVKKFTQLYLQQVRKQGAETKTEFCIRTTCCYSGLQGTSLHGHKKADLNDGFFHHEILVVVVVVTLDLTICSVCNPSKKAVHTGVVIVETSNGGRVCGTPKKKGKLSHAVAGARANAGQRKGKTVPLPPTMYYIQSFLFTVCTFGREVKGNK